jgi:hypothetical protein
VKRKWPFGAGAAVVPEALGEEAGEELGDALKDFGDPEGDEKGDALELEEAGESAPLEAASALPFVSDFGARDAASAAAAAMEFDVGTFDVEVPVNRCNFILVTSRMLTSPLPQLKTPVSQFNLTNFVRPRFKRPKRESTGIQQTNQA